MIYEGRQEEKMQYDAKTIEEYLAALPDDHQEAVRKLRDVILANLPEGFVEQMSYGMIGYVVPSTIYPRGYHVQKDQPLPFLALASQKNHIALYHMGLQTNPEVERWFVKEYSLRVPTKLDMGKSCIRFKNPRHIPYDLVAELCQKITVDEYIQSYEQALTKVRKKG